ncbi:MAG: Glu/Leu/Phe/Val dehydrogenase [Actinomycetota bacterium]
MLTDWSRLSDDLGPEKITLLKNPDIGLEAIVVVDNTAAGPAVGGIRMATDITVEEIFRLARAMTFKNTAAGLPHGGGKAGIIANPAMPDHEKERLIRAFANAIRDMTDYIPGPDMGTTEASMAQIHDEIGRAIGLPAVLGGIPLDTLGATAFGVVVAAQVAEDFGIVRVDGARVVIEGFGAVGTHTARLFSERGAKVITVSDSRGAVTNPDGLDVEKLIVFKHEGSPVHLFPGGMEIPASELVTTDCDIWVPAARPDTFTKDNAPGVRARLIVQGANIPATPEAETIFHERGIVVVPDFIANAGGVICGAVEYGGGTQRQAFDMIETKIRDNTREVLELSATKGLEPRLVAMEMTERRLREEMGYRRSF